MKLFAIILSSLMLLAACGGGAEPPVATIQVRTLALSAQSELGANGELTAIQIYQALYGKAPSYSMLNGYKNNIATTNTFVWAASIAEPFKDMSSYDLSTLILNNMSITPSSLKATAKFGSSQQAYAGLQSAVHWYFESVGVASRGTVIVQLADIISHFEGETTFGVYGDAATSFNRQVAANLSYSNNVSSLVAALVSTANANAGPTQSVATGQAVTLDASGSTAYFGKTLTYAWALTSKPDGSSASLSSANSIKPSFMADVVGTYVATLVVNDGVTNSKEARVNITVTQRNTAPVAKITIDAPYGFKIGDPIHLIGSASSDADGDPLTYAWAFLTKPAGSKAVLNPYLSILTAGLPYEKAFKPDIEGTYIVGLTVNDGKLDSTMVTATVATPTTDLTKYCTGRTVTWNNCSAFAIRSPMGTTILITDRSSPYLGSANVYCGPSNNSAGADWMMWGATTPCR